MPTHHRSFTTLKHERYLLSRIIYEQSEHFLITHATVYELSDNLVILDRFNYISDSPFSLKLKIIH